MLLNWYRIQEIRLHVRNWYQIQAVWLRLWNWCIIQAVRLLVGNGCIIQAVCLRVLNTWNLITGLDLVKSDTTIATCRPRSTVEWSSLILKLIWSGTMDLVHLSSSVLHSYSYFVCLMPTCRDGFVVYPIWSQLTLIFHGRCWKCDRKQR